MDRGDEARTPAIGVEADTPPPVIEDIEVMGGMTDVPAPTDPVGEKVDCGR